MCIVRPLVWFHRRGRLGVVAWGNVGETETTTTREACLTCKASNVAASAACLHCTCCSARGLDSNGGRERVPAARKLRLRASSVLACCTAPRLQPCFIRRRRRSSFSFPWIPPSRSHQTVLRGATFQAGHVPLHYYTARAIVTVSPLLRCVTSFVRIAQPS